MLRRGGRQDSPPMPVAAAVTPAEPAPHDPRQDFVSAATVPTYTTVDPTFQHEFYARLRDIGRKMVISGWDNVIDPNEREMMKQEFIDVLSMVAPLADASWKDVEKFVKITLEQTDPQLQIARLRYQVSAWIKEANFGLPERVKVVEWDLTPEDVIAEARARVAIGAEARAMDLVRP